MTSLQASSTQKITKLHFFSQRKLIILLIRNNLAGPIKLVNKFSESGTNERVTIFIWFFCLLYQTWPNFSEKISFKWLFRAAVYASSTKLIDPTPKTTNYMKFLLGNNFFDFDKGWVGATLEKSKYRLPRLVRWKFGVVTWISIYIRKKKFSTLTEISLSPTEVTKLNRVEYISFMWIFHQLGPLGWVGLVVE